MADEVAYSSVGGDSMKRKYEDSPSPMARRGTGFSGPPDSAAPPPSYSSVPPPMNEIELAKQKAQEIAARLLNNADPLKRARVDNGGGGGGGFDSSDYGNQKHQGLGLSGPPHMASSGYPGPARKIEIPNSRVGVIIGKGGETIKYLQLQSGAKIQVTRDMDADPNAPTRGVELMGTPDQVAKAEQLINDVLSEAEAGGSGGASRRVTGQLSGAEQFVMKVPNNKVGLVIGKGGETIKSMQARTGARIQVIPLHLPPGDTSQERTVQIDGTSEQIEAAKQLVEEVISENRVRNPSMSGGYPQQGYQSRPPTNWGQSGPPMQQPGYGYTQSGAYPGPSPQYNMNQPPYAGYPPQPTSGGYATGWDQSTAPNHQGTQGGSYDYYNQQQAHGQDGSGYGYSQATAYTQGQGYGQDGYSGYQAAAAQANPGSGYDQQQQGYNSSYGNVSNPTPDSYATQGEANPAPAPAPAPGQSYGAGAGGQPAPANPNYPPQVSTQPGYGAPPASHGGYGSQAPAGYGNYGPPQTQKSLYAQPQQSPTGQPGYPYSQPPSQAGYGQADMGSAAGYAAPPYGAAQTGTGYGQQQQAPAYGVGYSQQPPAYSSDAAGNPPPPPQTKPSPPT